MVLQRIVTGLSFAFLVIATFSWIPDSIYKPVIFSFISGILWLAGKEFAALVMTGIDEPNRQETAFPPNHPKYYLMSMCYVIGSICLFKGSVMSIKTNISNTWHPYLIFFFAWILLCFIVASASFLFSSTNIQKSSHKLLAFLSGFIYISLPGFTVLDLIDISHSLYIKNIIGERAAMLYYLLVIVLFGDIGAFFAGKQFGKTKLQPVVSPNKTVEGAIGGIIFSMLGSLCCSAIFHMHIVWPLCLLCAVLGCSSGVLGDLIQSGLKRGARYKDSGNLLPGHGGMWDRIDAILVSAPIIYVFLTLYYHYSV
jgi:phosphatidate cytidylyltransferase